MIGLGWAGVEFGLDGLGYIEMDWVKRDEVKYGMVRRVWLRLG